MSFAIVLVCWIILGIGSWIFYATATYETKKSAHPFVMIGPGIAFLGFTRWTLHGNVGWFALLPVALITFLNIRNIKFCPRCSATHYAQDFSHPKFCSKCGADLSGP